MNMLFKRKLPSPQEVIRMYPLSVEANGRKAKNDEEIRAALTGESGKFLLIAGPCSADREDAVLDYLSRLAKVREKVKDKIVIVPRIYTNKPRTTGEGYKETGFSGADEMLYPESHRYLGDILSYVTVGARSVENQQHRLTASGLDIPVGFKNPTSGDLSVMINALTAAQNGHDFAYGGWEVQSKGNPLAHAILRGSVNKFGQNIPNYHYEDLVTLRDLYAKTNLRCKAAIIDVNHSNSGKNAEEQPRIAKEVLHSMRHNKDVAAMIKGLMIESYLEDGCQKTDGTIYGKSITDPCIGWEKTERLICEIADLL